MFSFLSNIAERKILKKLSEFSSLVETFESGLKDISLEALKEKSEGLKERIRGGESLDQVLPEAFALVREASVRTLGKRHFDVQIMGGFVLHEGKIAEMRTGEGKTLVATLAAYANALSGKGVHVVTVNDYLAKRDAVWMGQIYNALGVSVSCIMHDGAYIYDPFFESNESLDKERDVEGGYKVVEKFLRPISRREAYEADITYGTNHEFGFDFLRDNLAIRSKERVQREHGFVIIDEVDSILIDEARTPLIIAAPDQESSEYYKTFARIVSGLRKEEDYLVDEKLKTVNITEDGIDRVEKSLGITDLFGPEHARLVHFLQESLKAKELFKKDKEYVVRDGEIIIVDEFTGRMLHGRRYSGGLHQAIEAKEGVFVKQENRTFAQITIQNYFRLYKKISGMTGTAETSAEEFHKVYDLDVVMIPTNKPMIREDASDEIYRTKEEKYNAVVREVKERHEKGQPVLVGTTSIQNNEIISSYLSRAGVPHEVLNAKNNEREGAIIAQAGKMGAVTVATNMAGRGVDIVLGGNPPDEEKMQKIRELGGLCIVGTERHEARRIDNQLRGRSGRQGDPGSSQFFLSLEDDLLRIFGGDRIQNLMNMMNFPKDTPIESKMVSKAVNQAQQKVEGNNFDIRKHLLEYDDVLNKQRTAIYAKRNKYIDAGEKGEMLPVLRELLQKTGEKIIESLGSEEEMNPSESKEKEKREVEEKFKKIPEKIDLVKSEAIGQQLVRILDMLWVDHLEHLEALRESVNIRAYGQHDPLVEYRREASGLFRQLHEAFEMFVFQTIFPIFDMKLERKEEKPIPQNQPKSIDGKKVGRNDPCPCGAKKKDGTSLKYKHCHGKNI